MPGRGTIVMLKAEDGDEDEDKGSATPTQRGPSAGAASDIVPDFLMPARSLRSFVRGNVAVQEVSADEAYVRGTVVRSCGVCLAVAAQGVQGRARRASHVRCWLTRAWWHTATRQPASSAQACRPPHRGSRGAGVRMQGLWVHKGR